MSHIPFFADDPNPWNIPAADEIRASSTAVMRLSPKWRVPESCEAYFVPNGETVRPSWWDNSFDNERAAKIWAQHGVKVTRRPSGYFSLYNLMPAAELFKVMDEVRVL